MTIDQRGLHELLEQSQDLHTDAMREVKPAVEELADLRSDRLRGLAPNPVLQLDAPRRRSFSFAKILGAGAFGTALAGLIARPAMADEALDVQMLQTASSLEVLAIATYGAALTLPFIIDGNPVVKAFAETTMKQHDEHRAAFQAMTKALNGKVQEMPNPKYAPVVEAAKATLKAPIDVVKLAATLEQVATETYLADLGMFTDTKARSLTASVMGVECQHLAILRAVGALLDGGAPELIKIPIGADAAKLPAAAGSVAFPEAFEGVTMASPAEEGAVK